MPPKGQPNRTSKSPNTRRKTDHQIPIPNTQALKLNEISALNELRQRFQRQIQNPIQLQTSIHRTKTPQRCLQHNNVITLYCIDDCKTLCVTCMYQNNHHKRHKVIPLNRASKQLKGQLDSSLQVVQNAVGFIDKLQSQSIANIEKAQRQFPQIIKEINKFYYDFQQLLKQKKQAHLKHIQQTWQRFKYQYSSIAQQMQNFKVYAMEKVNDLKTRSGQENLLFNRNVGYHLSRLGDHLSLNISAYHDINYMKQIQRFKEVMWSIDKKLVFTSPFQIEVSRDNPRNRNKTSASKSVSFSKNLISTDTENKQKQKELESDRKLDLKIKKLIKSVQKNKTIRSITPRLKRNHELEVSAHMSPRRSNKKTSFDFSKSSITEKDNKHYSFNAGRS